MKKSIVIIILAIVVSWVGSGGIMTCMFAFADGPPEWVRDAQGKWKGSVGGDESEMTIALSEDGLTVSYWFMSKGTKEEGKLSDLKFPRQRLLEATWTDKFGSGKCRLLFDQSLITFSGTYGSGDSFGDTEWKGFNSERAKAFVRDAAQVKEASEAMKGKTLVFKGFYLGMPAKSAAILLNHYLSWPDDDGNILVPETQEDGTIKIDKVAEANSKGEITKFIFPEALVHILFKSQNTPRKEFLQSFVNAYDVPSVSGENREVKFMGETLAYQGVYTHRSDKGFELNFYGDVSDNEAIIHQYGLCPAPGTLELKAIKTAQQRQSAFD